MGLFDAVKAFVTDPQNIQKAKDLATDKNVNAAAEKLKEFAPKQAGLIDGAAEKAKDWGGPEDEGAAPSEIAEGGNAGGNESDAGPQGTGNGAPNGDAPNGDAPNNAGNGDTPQGTKAGGEGNNGNDQNGDVAGNEGTGDAGN